jgi:hypothetical protein
MKTIEIKRGTIDEIAGELIEEGVPYVIAKGEAAEADLLTGLSMANASTILFDCNDARVIADGLTVATATALLAVAEKGFNVCLVVHEAGADTSFQLVSDMNTAFGNPKGDTANIDWGRVAKQCMNIPDETGELFVSLGAEEEAVKKAVTAFKASLLRALESGPGGIDVDGVRDALCDIQVFDMGAQHFIGVDGDADMRAVVDGVMTRFIKDDADKAATIALHAAKGVTDVYFEGEYPAMVMKSASDQPDAPKGKFLKSASFEQTVFYPLA